MRVVFMGTPAFSVPILDALVTEHEVVAVYCQPPRPAGRGQKERLSPVHQRALNLGLPVLTPLKLRDPSDQATFAAFNADVAVVAAYGLILPQAVLDAPRLGCVNVHASLLPRWRGAAPVQRAIMAGDAETGVTIMQMEAGLDTGPMLLSERVAIDARTTYQTLHDRLSEVGAAALMEAVRGLAAGTLTATPQPEEGVIYAAKITKAEAGIDWTQSAFSVSRHINGLSPFPGAWFEYAGERIKVLLSDTGKTTSAPAGTVVGECGIACGDGHAVRLLTLQRAGKGPVSAADFLRGFALPTGTRL